MAMALGYPARELGLIPPNGAQFWTGYGDLPTDIPNEHQLLITVADGMFETVITAPEFEIALESLLTNNIESMLHSVGLVDQISPEAGPLDQAAMLRIAATEPPASPTPAMAR